MELAIRTIRETSTIGLEVSTGSAIEYYGNLAIELDPGARTAAYNARGLAYDKLGEYHLAIADFDTAIEIDPEL